MQIPFNKKIEHLVETGHQILFIESVERDRIEVELMQIAASLKLKVVCWDGVSGFSTFKLNEDNQPEKTFSLPKMDPIEALQLLDKTVAKESADCPWGKGNSGYLFIFRNLHPYLEDVLVRQTVQNLFFDKKLSNTEWKHPLILLSDILQVHKEIEACVTLVSYALPDVQQLTEIVEEIKSSICSTSTRPGVITTCDSEMSSNIVQALKGLTAIDATNALAYSLRVCGGFSPELIDLIEDQKAAALQTSEVLTYIPKDKIATLDEVGGHDELKAFLMERKLAYTPAARAIKLDLPKGIVLLGIPGTGKSLICKIVARVFGLPLVIFNFASVLGSLVGESERRMRGALSTIDAMDGCIVLVDEADKALAGSSEAVGDSGVSRRIFGQLLTWLTEKTSQSFVVMPMNRPKNIPSEFFRKGRFDEIFYTDIPDEIERRQILEIHMKKRNVEISDSFNWPQLISATEKFVGSELEQVVCDARFMSFANRQSGNPGLGDYLEVASKIIPIANAEKENIEEIRKLCKDRARPVSKVRTKGTAKAKRATTLA